MQNKQWGSSWNTKKHRKSHLALDGQSCWVWCLVVSVFNEMREIGGYESSCFFLSRSCSSVMITGDKCSYPSRNLQKDCVVYLGKFVQVLENQRPETRVYSLARMRDMARWRHGHTQTVRGVTVLKFSRWFRKSKTSGQGQVDDV